MRPVEETHFQSSGHSLCVARADQRSFSWCSAFSHPPQPMAKDKDSERDQDLCVDAEGPDLLLADPAQWRPRLFGVLGFHINRGKLQISTAEGWPEGNSFLARTYPQMETCILREVRKPRKDKIKAEPFSWKMKYDVGGKSLPEGRNDNWGSCWKGKRNVEYMYKLW